MFELPVDYYWPYERSDRLYNYAIVTTIGWASGQTEGKVDERTNLCSS